MEDQDNVHNQREDNSGWNWTELIIPQTIQKRLIKFILKKSIGKFLAEEIDFDNLDVLMSQGQIELRNLDLDAEAINEYSKPLELEYGSVGCIKATIPFKDLWSSSCQLDVQDIDLCMRIEGGISEPSDDLSATPMEASIMEASVNLAKDFVEESIEKTDLAKEISFIHRNNSRNSISLSSPFQIPNSSRGKSSHASNEASEGLQAITRLVDHVFSKVKMNFYNIRVKLISPSRTFSDALIFDIPELRYFDVSSEYYMNDEVPESEKLSSENELFTKRLKFNEFYIDIFRASSDSSTDAENDCPDSPTFKHRILSLNKEFDSFIDLKLVRENLKDFFNIQVGLGEVNAVLDPQKIEFLLAYVTAFSGAVSSSAPISDISKDKLVNTFELVGDQRLRTQISAHANIPSFQICIFENCSEYQQDDELHSFFQMLNATRNGEKKSQDLPNHLLLVSNDITLKWNSAELELPSLWETRIGRFLVLEWINNQNFNNELDQLVVPENVYNFILQFYSENQEINDKSKILPFGELSHYSKGCDSIGATTINVGEKKKKKKYSDIYICNSVKEAGIDVEVTLAPCQFHIDPIGFWERISHLVELNGNFGKETQNDSVFHSFAIYCPQIALLVVCPKSHQIKSSTELNGSPNNFFVRPEFFYLTTQKLHIYTPTPKDDCPFGFKVSLEMAEVWAKSFDGSLNSVLFQVSETCSKSLAQISFNRQSCSQEISEAPLLSRMNNDSQPLNSETLSLFLDFHRKNALYLIQCQFSKVETSLPKDLYDLFQSMVNEFIPVTAFESKSDELANSKSTKLWFNIGIENGLVNLENGNVFSGKITKSSLYFVSGLCGNEDENFVALKLHNINLGVTESIEEPKHRKLLHRSTLQSQYSPNEADIDQFIMVFHSSLNQSLNLINTTSSILLENNSILYSFSTESYISDLVNFFGSSRMNYTQENSSKRKINLDVDFSNTSIILDFDGKNDSTVLAIEKATLKSTLRTNSDNTSLKIGTSLISIFLIDDSDNIKKTSLEAPHSRKPENLNVLWSLKNYVNIGDIRNLEATVNIESIGDSEDKNTCIKVENIDVNLGVCADSWKTLLNAVPSRVSQEVPKFETNDEETQKKIVVDFEEDALIVDENMNYVAPPNHSENNALEPLEYIENHYAEPETNAYESKEDFEDVGDEFLADWEKNAFNFFQKHIEPEDLGVVVDHDSSSSVCKVKTLVGEFEELNIVENYLDTRNGTRRSEQLLERDSFYSVKIVNSNVNVKFYAGFDWEKNLCNTDKFMNDSKSNGQNSQDDLVEIIWEDELGSYGSNNQTSKPNESKIKNSHKKNRLRDESDYVEFDVRGLELLHKKFREGEPRSAMRIRLKDFEIIDGVKSSLWKKFLTYSRPEKVAGNPDREHGSNMLSLDIFGEEPNPELDLEYRVYAKMLPLRLYIDQDAVNFLVKFFAYEDLSLYDDLEDNTLNSPKLDFIQFAEIAPVKISLDYKPKRINLDNLKNGKFIEILNLFRLENSEATLKKLQFSGVSGYSNLLGLVFDGWISHITQSQIPNIATGVTPIRSAINIGSGVANLIILPIEQVKRDGRLLFGLKQGAQNFLQTTAVETLNIGSKLAVGTQVFLENIDKLFYPNEGNDAEITLSKFANQPKNFNEGLELAVQSLSKNVTNAVDTIIAIPKISSLGDGEDTSESSMSNILKAVPLAILRPLIGTSEALRQTFLGVRNSINPDALIDNQEKYKS